MEINKEVDLLDNLIGMIDDNQENDYDAAFRMAINALRAQADSDTISRKATIEAMEDIDWYHISKDGRLVHGANSKEDEPLYKASDVYKALERVPSAQPETHEKRTETHACDCPIIRCKECKHWLDIDNGRQKHRMCADIYGDWYCADAERRTDG